MTVTRDTSTKVVGPNDGRPCSADAFIAALAEDGSLEAAEACKCWAHGDWYGALEFLPIHVRAALTDGEEEGDE